MEPEKKSNGALVGLVIIIIILLVGGIYIWQAKNRDAAETNNLTSEENQELESLQMEVDSTNTEMDVNADTIE